MDNPNSVVPIQIVVLWMMIAPTDVRLNCKNLMIFPTPVILRSLNVQALLSIKFEMIAHSAPIAADMLGCNPNFTPARSRDVFMINPIDPTTKNLPNEPCSNHCQRSEIT